MGKYGLCRIWGFQSSCITCENHDDEQPSTNGSVHTASVSPSDLHSLQSLGEFDLGDMCDQIFVLLKNIENARQSKQEQTRRLDPEERRFWQKLACFLILTELFRDGKPDESILELYFPKGDNDASTLAYMIFRDVPYPLWLGVGLCVGASLEKWYMSLAQCWRGSSDWFNVDKEIKEECLHVFWEMWRLAKLLWELKNPQTQILERLPELRSFQLLLVQGSIMCSDHPNDPYLRRNLNGCTYKESFKWFLRKVKSTNETLHEWSQLSMMYQGLGSSPLFGRPGMNNPHHAVGIEREKQDVIQILLKRNSGMKTMALIGKTTVADAVFTSVHIPLCNYITFSWLSSRV